MKKYELKGKWFRVGKTEREWECDKCDVRKVHGGGREPVCDLYAQEYHNTLTRTKACPAHTRLVLCAPPPENKEKEG